MVSSLLFCEHMCRNRNFFYRCIITWGLIYDIIKKNLLLNSEPICYYDSLLMHYIKRNCPLWSCEALLLRFRSIWLGSCCSLLADSDVISFLALSIKLKLPLQLQLFCMFLLFEDTHYSQILWLGWNHYM